MSKPWTAPDPEFIAWLHTQQCAAFEKRLVATGLLELSPCVGRITAHHAGDHGLSQRAPDRTAIPLCVAHHLHEGGPHSVHRLGKGFYKFHGLDKSELIKKYNLDFESQNVRSLTALDVAELEASL